MNTQAEVDLFIQKRPYKCRVRFLKQWAPYKKIDLTVVPSPASAYLKQKHGNFSQFIY